MAVRYGVRWRPQAYRSINEANIVNRDMTATPPRQGQRVQTLQLIVFDDTKIGAGNPYTPGAPATEQHLSIVDEAAIALEVSAFAGLTNAQSTLLWDAARDSQQAKWQADPTIMNLVRCAIGGSLSSHIVIG